MHDLQVGPVRLSAYGACAAVGVVLSMALAGRSARRSGIAPEAAWDAGLFAVISCFAASRLLLVLSDPRAFLRYPLLVLGLPSLTIAGMALAGVATSIYLWRRRLPVKSLLDAFAPAGALLAVFLELGHWLDRSEVGMPVPGHAGEFRPVSVYGMILSSGVAIGLWSALRRVRVPGRVSALGLMVGGLAAFALDTLSLPVALIADWWLEPGQCVALAAMLGGALLWTFAPVAERGAVSPAHAASKHKGVG